jgi:murein DD-endopeptidase MepM/ murein hydrolase activator NlpD
LLKCKHSYEHKCVGFFMIKYTINFPFARFQFSFKKRRSFRAKKYISNKLTAFQAIRKGSKISRLFRFLFEHKRIKALLGGSLAVLVIITSVFSTPVSALSTISETEITTLSEGPIELTTTKTQIRVPLEKTIITQRYGLFHTGLDLDGITGDPMYPIMQGRVESIIYSTFGLGKHLTINHGSGLKSVYGHLSKINVEAGDEVTAETKIGEVGNTGRSFGDHLHLFQDGKRINPAILLKI